MRKTISLLLAVLVLVPMILLTACGNKNATVESVMEIDSNYVGHRKITVTYPLDADIDELTEILKDNSPIPAGKASKFEYFGVEQDGYSFVLDIVFDSQDDYIAKMSELVGRQVQSDMQQMETVMCTGTRMKEDFDVSDIIRWMTDLSLENEHTKNIDFEYSVNTVSINGTVFNTDSTVDISEREGEAVESITIETANLKNDTFDRTVAFLIPNKTYEKLAGSIESYFASITPNNAQYADWTNKGENWEYKVILKGVENLGEGTVRLLGNDFHHIGYGHFGNVESPLSESLAFEESFNTFSFVGKKGEAVELTYKYALPTKTTHGDGMMLTNGSWEKVGKWSEGVYSVTTDSDIFNIRIPDGIQYSIEGIDMKLHVLDNDSFTKTIEFLYEKADGMDAMLFAQDFFRNKGALVETGENDEHLFCRVTCSGTSSQITDQYVALFGSGNFMTYKVKQPALSLSKKSRMTDYIDFSYMLNSENAQKPITYTVESDSNEKIKNLSLEGGETVKHKSDDTVFCVLVPQGKGVVSYKGKIPNAGRVVLFCIVSVSIISLAVAVFYLKFRKKKKDGKKVKLSSSEELLTDSELKDEIDREVEENIGNMSDEDISELERLVNECEDEQEEE